MRGAYYFHPMGDMIRKAGKEFVDATVGDCGSAKPGYGHDVSRSRRGGKHMGCYGFCCNHGMILGYHSVGEEYGMLKSFAEGRKTPHYAVFCFMITPPRSITYDFCCGYERPMI